MPRGIYARTPEMIENYRQAALNRPTGNHSLHPATYQSWQEMFRRCNNPKHNRFHCYGGRGIKIYDRWQKFENFLFDMKERPPKLTLDRIDNNKGYFPKNCRWATMKQQQNNRSNNRKISYKGETRNIAEWASITGINYKTIHIRLSRGWSLDRIFQEAANDNRA